MNLSLTVSFVKGDLLSNKMLTIPTVSSVIGQITYGANVDVILCNLLNSTIEINDAFLMVDICSRAGLFREKL